MENYTYRERQLADRVQALEAELKAAKEQAALDAVEITEKDKRIAELEHYVGFQQRLINGTQTSEDLSHKPD